MGTETKKAMTTLTVTTRKGTITFDSTLTWDEAVSTLAKASVGGLSDFAKSLLSKAQAGSRMSQAQVSWVYKLAQDEVEARSAKAPKAVSGVDASGILGALTSAYVSGLKRPRLRLTSPDGVAVVVMFMMAGSNAGGAWVTANGELAGKIDANGEYTPRNAQGEELMVFMALSSMASVGSALFAHGQMSSQCGCCGLPLTNPESIARGIGPICAVKFGLV